MRYAQVYCLCKYIARGVIVENIRPESVTIQLTADEYLDVVNDHKFNIPHTDKEFICLGVRVWRD
jgi:hypothetical protein